MANGYAFQGYDKATMSRASVRDLGISTKHSIEICSAIRNKRVITVKSFLENVIAKKVPVRYTRFNWGVGHRKGTGAAGRYPVKAAAEILMVIESAEKNAQQKGLNSADLVIRSIVANNGPRVWHYGRQRRRKTKRTHIEIVLAQKAKGSGKEKKEKSSKEDKK